jgi:hypothetical protein
MSIVTGAGCNRREAARMKRFVAAFVISFCLAIAFFIIYNSWPMGAH